MRNRLIKIKKNQKQILRPRKNAKNFTSRSIELAFTLGRTNYFEARFEKCKSNLTSSQEKSTYLKENSFKNNLH
jgi:hypothetical protein